jgi:hypothetical protein
MISGWRRQLAVSGVTLVGATALVFGVGAPPERCPDLTVAELEGAAEGAVGWLVDNQQPDGRYLYEYDRSTDVASDDYNIVRHAGVMSSLYQAAARGYDGALESADRGLDWILDQRVDRNGWIGVTTSSNVQAGTNALLVAALAERRELTGDTSLDGELAGLARFLVDQTEPSGALLAYYDLEPDRPRAGSYSIYYTGEAYWALGRMHRAFPDDEWGAVADRIGAYMATERDEAEDVWPPLADHWSGYGLAETAAFPERPAGTPLTDDEVTFVQRQGGLMGQRVRSISQRFGPWGVAVRGTFTPRGGGYGVFGEGLTGLWRASVLDERLADDRDTIADRATCIAALGIEAQSGPDDAADYVDPVKVDGAWFLDDITRMDDQQHALSALLFTVPIVEAANDASSGSSGHPAPMWLLWMVVVVGVLNPFRMATGARGVARRDVAIGSALGVAVLLAVGALSGGVIDLVGTSRPSLRLATAALCLLTAGIDLARPRAGADETSGGPGWLVPVGIPLVVRPALLLSGLSVVADHSVPFYLLALVVAVGAGAAAAISGFAERCPPAVLVWSARLLSAVAVVASALLIADAVFDY